MVLARVRLDSIRLSCDWPNVTSREVDEAIARLRGWRLAEDGYGWVAKVRSVDRKIRPESFCCYAQGGPPLFSGAWEWSGPLWEELFKGGITIESYPDGAMFIDADFINAGKFNLGAEVSLTEVGSRLWLAWKAHDPKILYEVESRT